MVAVEEIDEAHDPADHDHKPTEARHNVKPLVPRDEDQADGRRGAADEHEPVARDEPFRWRFRFAQAVVRVASAHANGEPDDVREDEPGEQDRARDHHAEVACVAHLRNDVLNGQWSCFECNDQQR